ncbi:class I SAM-dependent methyltransferase [Billgrantia azerbaijanica]|nr:class I SAM-dependent methyltransferase [Halomonas azerbaijanica]
MWRVSAVRSSAACVGCPCPAPSSHSTRPRRHHAIRRAPMLRRNNPELDIGRLTDAMSQRLERTEPPPPWPGETAWVSEGEGRIVALGASRLRGSAEVDSIHGLLSLPDDDFIQVAHRLAYGRLPDGQEHDRILARLHGGLSREAWLLEAAEAGEGLALPGARRVLALTRLARLPKIGRLVRWLSAALRLDRLRSEQNHAQRLQDARYHALLQVLRDQAARLDHLDGTCRRLSAERDVLEQRLAAAERRAAQAPSAADATRAPAGPDPDSAPLDDPRGRDFYRALEARFRGEPGAIAELMREHLPRVAETPAMQEGRALLDLGCGRGEWLRLVEEAGFTARGVDLNAANVSVSRAEGLEVRYQDALGALRDQPDQSLGMITAFHLVEHLTPEALHRLLQEVHRALAPGGRLLLETPNPHNLNVGSCTFYLDPTHERPIPPEYLAFLAEFVGFADTAILPLHPVGSEHHLQEESETARRLNHYLYGPQDYALLASRPHPQAPEETPA